MAQDLLSIVLAGIQKGEKDAKEKERKKALANFITSLDTLSRGEQGEEKAPDLAPQVPQMPQPPEMPLPGPTSPNLPLPPDMSGFGQMSPMGPAPAPAGPLSGGVSPQISPMAGGGQLERIRQGLFPALTQAGDYAPEAIQMIHNLFGTKLFGGEEAFGTVTPGGSVYSKTSGAITGQAPERASKPTYGVSPGGWLTVITPDGAGGFDTKELVGVKPTDIVKEGMKGETARDVANIRGRYQLMSAQERAAAAKTVAQIRQTAGDKINSPAKLYTYLTQKWIDGTANVDEIAVLKHLEPVIIKMGGLQMLMEMETGKKSNVAPWESLPEEEQPDPEAAKEMGWWGSLFGKQGGSVPTAPGVPPGTGKGPQQSITQETVTQDVPRARATLTFGGKAHKLTPPPQYTEKQIGNTLLSVETAIKKKNKDPQAVMNILRQNGWTIE